MRSIFGRFEGTACAAGRTLNTGGTRFLKLATAHFNDALIGAFGTRSGEQLFTYRIAMSYPFNAVWLDRSQTAPKARSQPSNEKTYDEYVAGKEVAATLVAAQRFLWERAIAGFYSEKLPWE